ncbi:hypothetical protein LTS03_008894 [Exophiala xenobiotica]|nr:hypothetical protein LTS03_008894 [Exophiala xenobiotica]
MASVAEKHALGTEKSTAGLPSDPENAPGTGATIEETYELETPYRNKLFKWAYILDDKIGIEADGMEPTSPSRRTSDIPYFDMAAMWMSSNGVVGSMPTGLLGPVVFGLSFKASIIIVIFVNMLGALLPAFSSTFGPKYGFRQMVLSRYSFGYYGTKFIVSAWFEEVKTDRARPNNEQAFLEFVTNLGWSLVTALVGAEVMVALTDDKLPIIPSIIVISLIALTVATFGYRLVHFCTRYMWAFNFFIMIIFATIGSLRWDPTWPAQGTGLAQAGSTLSFMGVIFGSACGYTPVASDFYCKYPSTTPWWKPALLTWSGIVVAGILFNGMGAALGAAIMSDPELNDAYTNDGFGQAVALIFAPLGAFGKFCLVIWWLGTSGNLIGNTYSNSIAAQVIGFGLEKIPRFMLAIISTIIYAVIAIAGRERLQSIFENFLSILGYWVCAYFVIIFQEHFLFRFRREEYNRDAWNTPKMLPRGFAAMLSFWIGIMGAFMGMSQTWFVGPLSRHFGPYGGDLGAMLCSCFVAITYPVFRTVERKYFKL